MRNEDLEKRKITIYIRKNNWQKIRRKKNRSAYINSLIAESEVKKCATCHTVECHTLENERLKRELNDCQNIIRQFLGFRDGNFYDFKKALALAKRLSGEK